MTFDILAANGLRAAIALGLAGALAACASSAPVPDRHAYAPPPPPPSPVNQPQAVAQPPAPAPVQPPVGHPQAHAQSAPPRSVAQFQSPPAEQQVAIGGTAFPADGSPGQVPEGARLVVRVYDAAGGDVNIRVAEGAFRIEQGLPARYTVPVPVRAMRAMDMPAVAARVEARGRVIYRNETAVLLKQGAAGDIPMTLQRRQAASAVTIEWDEPATN